MPVIKRLRKIAPWQTAKTIALVYFLFGIVLAIPLGLLSSLVPTPPGETQPGIIFFLCLPFLYALAALIFVPIGCWIYNFSARHVGGIEVVVDSRSDA